MREHRHRLCFSVWSAGYRHTWVTVKKADFLRCDLEIDMQTISLGNVWLDSSFSGFLRAPPKGLGAWHLLPTLPSSSLWN